MEVINLKYTDEFEDRKLIVQIVNTETETGIIHALTTISTTVQNADGTEALITIEKRGEANFLVVFGSNLDPDTPTDAVKSSLKDYAENELPNIDIRNFML